MEVTLLSNEQSVRNNTDFINVNVGKYVILVSADKNGGFDLFVQFANAPFITVSADGSGIMQARVFTDAGAFARDALRQRESERKEAS